MKFLIDENLPPALVAWLVDRGHDAAHVVGRGLRGASDSAIATTALAEQRVILTRDADFDAAALGDHRLRVMRLTHGNAPTAALLAWLEPRLDPALQQLGRGEHLVIVD